MKSNLAENTTLAWLASWDPSAPDPEHVRSPHTGLIETVRYTSKGKPRRGIVHSDGSYDSVRRDGEVSGSYTPERIERELKAIL